mmetsp:Transcript_83731/g.218664  ORF Transcript_83731/g.218664 Transcript_83731/m.218664 type:complete len:321 (-) Transcript_83731:62-1024(-)
MEAPGGAGTTLATLGGHGEAILLTIVTLVVLRVELVRRYGDVGAGPLEAGRYTQNFKHFMKQYAPEVAGLVAILTLAAALRARGDKASENTAGWAEIKEQWPMLMGADTLLALQAMLRFTLLVSTILRAPGGPVPLSGDPAALWFCGAAARVALLARTPCYMLDGPLGGSIAAAFEVAALPVLFGVNKGFFRSARLSTLLAIVGTAAFAHRNRLNLANDEVSDSLFMFAQLADMLAALAYLLRTALIDSSLRLANVSVGFTHLLMPAQAALSAYYFLQAFEMMPSLVGQGQPFEVLQIGNTAALGAYLGAAALHVAECVS